MLVKAAYLSNDDIIRVADYAAWVRRTRANDNATTDLRAVA
jgi:S-DNA-T family DNA segregation ATPase FtsK/SpoIIIE